MNAIQEVKDESIRKVAQTLKASGLAMSDTEAIRMAMMMSKTSQKVTQNFEQKKNDSTMGIRKIGEPVHSNTSSSVQGKPRKTEEKEEFIFGDVQEQKPVQKKDVYTVENEFEEVVSQDLISTKPVQKPAAAKVPSQAAATQSHTVPAASISSKEPVSAAGSSQMAFSFMLGAAQKNAAYADEVKKHTPQQAPTKAQEVVHNSAPVQPQPQKQVVHPVTHVVAEQKPVQPQVSPQVSPQKKMMQEANVDITKMFNFNK